MTCNNPYVLRKDLEVTLSGFDEVHHRDRPQCAMTIVNDSDEDDSSGCDRDAEDLSVYTFIHRVRDFPLYEHIRKYSSNGNKQSCTSKHPCHIHTMEQHYTGTCFDVCFGRRNVINLSCLEQRCQSLNYMDRKKKNQNY